MPKHKIPCEDCDKEKKKIEEAGDCVVDSCTPIPGEPKWCMIEWHYKT